LLKIIVTKSTVKTYNPRPTNDTFSNNNPSWRNQLNFFYRSNAPPMP